MGINAVVRYFDLASRARGAARAFGAGGAPLPWLPQYAALLVGIVVQRFFSAYLQSGHWDLTGFWGWLFASCILGVMAFPAVYKPVFDPQKPLFVQLCVIFSAGMGWESLVHLSEIGTKSATGG
jgi:hypothetical protein